MTPELWQRLKPLYSEALDLPEGGRTGFIEQMCLGDPELARELRALLAANQSAANTLDPPLNHFSVIFPSRPSALEPGALLDGRFRIVRHLGSGGMGDVYEAQDLQLEPGRIALKTLRPSIAQNASALARFKAEVLLARRVTGPNVCRIYDLHLPSATNGNGGVAFLTMELLEGETLYDRIAYSHPMPVDEICTIMQQLCAALQCIHEAGVIHRDLKTRNVMLVPQNGSYRAVVTDFGLARVLARETTDSGASFAEDGLIAGTPSSMAPEQFEGREVSRATDIYALGLILYELITGTQPFAAGSVLGAAIRRSKAPDPPSRLRPEIPPGWDTIVARCLQYEPALRFQSAEEVTDALCRPTQLVLRLGKAHPVAVERRTLAMLATGILLLVLAGLWLRFRAVQYRTVSPEAAHWYAQGMTALREGSYLKATHLLTMATERDPGYALAHAALADAWAELDFTSQAEHEMLLATSPREEKKLSDLDRRYVDAVRTTLVRDYSAAAQDYEEILQQLPNDSKAQGYVDLGRIYEKAGRVPETIASYEKAAALNPDDPAPFLHLGILKSRLRQPDAANVAFARAESLYGAESDLEGLAEVDYQRGYAANEAAASEQANQYLGKSLAVARQIPNVQLQVRSLSQLSSVAYNDSKDDQAIAYAKELIQMAEANGLEYWATDGRFRLASAYLDKEDYADAAAQAHDALNRAHDAGHPRLEANALLTLASISFQQQHWDDDIQYAQRALPYFRDYGFLASADRALTLIARGERNQGDYTNALSTGNQLLATAERTHSPESVMYAEELIGGILLQLERYPEALPRFEHALAMTETLKQSPAYQQLHCAEALWPLGRFTEAQAELARIPANLRTRLDFGSATADINAAISLSRLEPRAALATVDAVLKQHPELETSSHSTYLRLLKVQALAEVALGHEERARAIANGAVTASHERPNALNTAQSEWLQARIDLRFGDPASARKHAETAEAYFAQNNMLESEALSLLTAAQAAQAVGDVAGAGSLSKKSVDSFRQMSQSWGDSAFHTYLTRPDLQQAVRILSGLRASYGDSLDDLRR